VRTASERFVIYAPEPAILSSAVLPFGVSIDEGNSLRPERSKAVLVAVGPVGIIYIQPLYLVDEEFFRDVTSSKLRIRKSAPTHRYWQGPFKGDGELQACLGIEIFDGLYFRNMAGGRDTLQR